MSELGGAELDLTDPLADKRALFALPPGVVYLDGNSLGALPHRAREAVQRMVEEEWGHGLIRSWNSAGWIDIAQRIGSKLEVLLGAEPQSIIACDSTSINLYKALHTACALRPDRKIILTDIDNFPSDLYIIDSVAKELGLQVRAVAKQNVAAAINREVAVVELTQVDYRSATVYDMNEITALAHYSGALMLWDLAHSAGAIPVDLTAADADFAIGCGYKYLNGGPGAPAYVYVSPRFAKSIQHPLHGWFGHARPFEFERNYESASGVTSMLVGTPSVLSMTALSAALDVFDDVSLNDLQTKSLRLSSFFFDLAEKHLVPRGFEVISERGQRRGSHVAMTHPGGYAIIRTLIERNVIGDFRRPDILRFGFAPLYNSFMDVETLVAQCIEIVDSKIYLSPEFATEARVI